MNFNPDTPSSDPILLMDNACLDFGGGADVLLLDNCSASQLETAVCEAGA